MNCLKDKFGKNLYHNIINKKGGKRRKLVDT
jgi:hypothetical protein